MANRKRIKQTAIDIVIATGGRFDKLKLCLNALQAQEGAPKFAVHLLDNNTNTKERLHHKDLFEHPVVTDTKRFTQDMGFPAINNAGARMGVAPYILFLNDDVELFPDALKQLYSVMKKDADMGVIGAKLLFPNDSTSPIRPAGKVQHVGMASTIRGQISHPLVGWSADHPKCNVSREVICVTGACLMVRRDLWGRIGGFFEGYGAGTYEDVELCFAVRQLGKKVFINVDAMGYHYTGATSEKKQVAFPLQQNAMTFKARWAQSGLYRWSDWEFF